MTKLNIEGLDWAAVLAALFNHTQPFGMGAHDPRSPARRCRSLRPRNSWTW